jgi:hypothetical protein
LPSEFHASLFVGVANSIQNVIDANSFCEAYNATQNRIDALSDLAANSSEELLMQLKT